MLVDDELWGIFDGAMAVAPSAEASTASSLSDLFEGFSIHEKETRTDSVAKDDNKAAIAGALRQTRSRAAQIEEEEAAQDQCPHCKGADIGIEDGNYVCRTCHTVVTRFIDNAPEWRYYGSEDNRATNPTRCGPPTNEFIPTLGTSVSVSYSRGSAYGAHGGKNGATGAANAYKCTRMMQKYQMWNSMTHQERNLYGIFDMLTVNAANHGISLCILEEAKSLYKRIAQTRISRGENRSALIACSIYMACKTNNVPRSVKEIATIFDVRTSALTRACKLFQDMMRTNVMSSRPIDFVPRFCSKLGLGPDVVALCERIIATVDELSVASESTPPSLVASVIYMACVTLRVEGACKKRIAEACQISHVTISKCYKKLEAVRDKLVPDDVQAWLRRTLEEQRHYDNRHYS